MTKPLTCPECGKRFTPWRKKQYCSESCKRRVQNRRMRHGLEAEKPALATTLPDSPKSEKIIEENQGAARAVSTYEGPTAKLRESEWLAVNEITDKLNHRGTAIAWAMHVGGRGWFGRVRDDRGDWSFHATGRQRARAAAEAWIKHEPFEKFEDEASWRGNCMSIM